MRVALFDFDHTLLHADSNQLWIDYLHGRGLVDSAAFAKHAGFMQDYRAGTLDFMALDAFRGGVDAAIPASRIDDCRADFTKNSLLAAVAPGAGQLLRELRDQQVLTMVVSASRESLVRPVAEHLGIEQILAADSRRPGGPVVPCFGAGKIDHVDFVLAGLGTSLDTLDRSWFYSDSHNDLPLMRMVRTPVAVDPDDMLLRHSREMGWKIITLR